MKATIPFHLIILIRFRAHTMSSNDPPRHVLSDTLINNSTNAYTNKRQAADGLVYLKNVPARDDIPCGNTPAEQIKERKPIRWKDQFSSEKLKQVYSNLRR